MVLVVAGNSGVYLGDVSMAVSEEGILYTWGQGAVGHHGAAPGASLVPVPVAATLPPGVRVGRGCRLPRQFALAFGMGTHARLGRTAQPSRPGARTCALAALLPAATRDGAHQHVPPGTAPISKRGVAQQLTRASC